MKGVFYSLEKLITKDLVFQSSHFEENTSRVFLVVSTTMPSLFALFIQKGKGNSIEVENVLEEAYVNSADIISNISVLFSGRYSEKNYIGSEFLRSILKKNEDQFYNIISLKSGVSNKNTIKLVEIISCFFIAFLSNRYKNSGLNLEAFLRKLTEEKSEFIHLIPTEMCGIMSVSSMSEIGNLLLNQDEIEEFVDAEGEKINSLKSPNRDNFNEKENNEINRRGSKKYFINKYSKSITLIVCILFLASVAMFSSLKAKKIELGINAIESDAIKKNSGKELIEIKFSKNLIIYAYKNGIEEQLMRYLVSKTKNNIKFNKFNFDNIGFEIESGNKLTKGSQEQIDNVSDILLTFKNAKLGIHVYTNEKQSEEENLKLSKERANTIKNILKNSGINVYAKGFGSKYTGNCKGNQVLLEIK